MQAAVERAFIDDELAQLIGEALDELGWTRLTFDREKLVATLRTAYEAGLLAGASDIIRALHDAGQAAPPITGMSFNLTNPAALQALEERGLRLVRNLEEGTRTYMLDSFRSAFTEYGPGSPDALARAIYANLTSDEQGAFSKKRVGSIVRTEMNAVHSTARLEQYRAAGLKRKRWIAVPSVACSICMGNQDMGAIPLEDQFSSVFGGVSGPPGHPSRCHCRLDIDLEEILDIAMEDISFWDGGSEVERHLPGKHNQQSHASKKTSELWAGRIIGGTADEQKKVKAALDIYPPQYVSTVREIRISRNPTVGGTSVRGYLDPRRGVLVLNNSDPRFFGKTAGHELAHAFEDTLPSQTVSALRSSYQDHIRNSGWKPGQDGQSVAWSKMKGPKPISDYAMTNFSEYIAESVSTFAKNPIMLQKKDPKTHTILTEVGL